MSTEDYKFDHELPLVNNQVLDPLRSIELRLFQRGDKVDKDFAYRQIIGDLDLPIREMCGSFYRIDAGLAIAESPDLPLGDERLVIRNGIRFIGEAGAPNKRKYDDPPIEGMFATFYNPLISELDDEAEVLDLPPMRDNQIFTISNIYVHVLQIKKFERVA